MAVDPSLSIQSPVPAGAPPAASHLDEQVFLESPQSRSHELWRVLRIAREFMMGFRALHFVGPCVSVFGSARFFEHHPYYVLARQMGARLSQMGFTVMTGGGPGLMEAANRGAKDAGGRSVGCNILLPTEQTPNSYRSSRDVSLLFCSQSDVGQVFLRLCGTARGLWHDRWEVSELREKFGIALLPVLS